jgi:hypothetical protein
MGGGDNTPGIDTGIQLRVNDARTARAVIQTRGAKPGAIHSGDDTRSQNKDSSSFSRIGCISRPT